MQLNIAGLLTYSGKHVTLAPMNSLQLRRRIRSSDTADHARAKAHIENALIGRTMRAAAAKLGIHELTLLRYRKALGLNTDTQAHTIRARLRSDDEQTALQALDELQMHFRVARSKSDAARLMRVSTSTVAMLKREYASILPRVCDGEAAEHRAAMQSLPPEVLATARRSLLGNWVVTVEGVAEPLCSMDAVHNAIVHFAGA